MFLIISEAIFFYFISDGRLMEVWAEEFICEL